jgi:hypothetical protein
MKGFNNMITKNDCLTILVSLEDRGVNIDQQMKKLLTTKEIPMDILKFILDNRGIEVANFYEMLRKKHNQKKSPLYHNIVKDITDPEDIITTLACLLVQITLYSKKLPANKEIFQREVRAEEISRVLNNYYSTGMLDSCIALMKLLKSDLLVLEHISGRRDLLN